MQPADSVSLSGSVAVVTGGGRGIGHAIVNQLALMKATVVWHGS
jgi:NAD(P)-dependent dehydrogenase (short-subunit alcohol dehydrogenase family)